MAQPANGGPSTGWLEGSQASTTRVAASRTARKAKCSILTSPKGTPMTARAEAATDEATRLDPALEIGNAPNTGRAVATRNAQTPAAPARAGLLRPVAPIKEILEQQNELREYIKEGLKEGRDYGNIPGIEKPSLLKPGAERINAAYGIVAEWDTVQEEVDHDRVNEWRKEKRRYEGGTWNGAVDIVEGTSFGLYRFVVLCRLVDRAGNVVGSCIGSCSTLESKYIDRPRDSENTVWKMAQKRAYIGATLLAYGLSDQFTQDVEDTPDVTADGNGGEKGGPEKVAAPKCPVHNVAMKDQRRTKRNVKAPDWKCTRFHNEGGQKVWCQEVKWPGEWPPKPKEEAKPAGASAPEGGEENPFQPTPNGPATTSAPTSEPRDGSAGTPSGEPTTESEGAPSSTPTTVTDTAEASANDSPATKPNGSPSSPETSGATSTTEPVHRSTVIEWATDKALASAQGKRIQDLAYKALDWFVSHPAAIPGAIRESWLGAMQKEMQLREDTGGDDRDAAGDPYNG